MVNGGLKVIEESFQKREARFKKELERAKKEINADTLHDLRVSIRRLQAVFLLLRLLPRIKVKKSLYQRPKTIMNPLGELRDIHVEVEIINDVFKRKNQFIKLFLNKLNKDIEQKEENVRRVVESFSLDFLKRLDIKKILIPLADTDLEYQIKIVLATLFRNFFSFREDAEGGNINAFHRMRISLKKLRYTSEILQPVFPWITEVRLNNMHALQQVMGDIHDLDVLIQRVNGQKLKDRNLTCLQAVTSNRLHKRRALLFNKEFIEQSEAIFSYEKDFATFPDIDDGSALQAAFLLLLKEIKKKKEESKIKDALLYARNIHIVHPLRTAIILAGELKVNEPDIIAAALLHDTLEIKGTVATREKIEKDFGKRVASLVWNLTKEDREIKSMDVYLQKIKSGGESTKMIKLADRLDSLRHLSSKNKKKQRARWKSTLEEFVPICKDINPSRWNFFYREYQKLWEETDPEVKKGLVLP